MGLISLDFAIFLLVVLPLNWALRPFKVLYRLFLLGASYAFYGSLSLHFLLMLVHFSFWTWLLGLGIGAFRRAWLRKGLLTLHLVLGIGQLVFFKYYDLFYETLSQAFAQMGFRLGLPDFDMAVPVGLSFFTFQGLSYSIDVFRNRHAVVKNPLDVSLFVAFFPTILSGPIMRAADFVPQIGNIRLDRKSSVEAFSLILTGLAKKLVVSSYLFSHVVQPVFENPWDYSSLCAAIGALGYSVQILCDFSGYTDLVTGIALLMGYSIPQNFNNPYSAKSLRDFWRRWHISLSFWLRDYLYTPLGGNRRGPWRKYVNIFITMTLGGLWHGAHWNFLVWGCFHGMGLVVTHLFADARGRLSPLRGRAGTPAPTAPPPLVLKAVLDALSWFSTFAFVTIGWVFFGTNSLHQALALLQRIFDFDLRGNAFSHYITLTVACVIAVVLLNELLRMKFRDALRGLLQVLPLPFQTVLLGLLISILLRLAPDGVPEFIYYQF
jgi:alginate O-acetyltransferase complex protein AlgI